MNMETIKTWLRQRRKLVVAFFGLIVVGGAQALNVPVEDLISAGGALAALVALERVENEPLPE